MKQKDNIIEVSCSNCGGDLRNHKVIGEHRKSWNTDDYRGDEIYQICECLGCEYVKFRRESYSDDDYNPVTGEIDSRVEIYPQDRGADRKADSWFEYPDKVARIYKETIKAFNVDALVLAGAGLRAIVEALCEEKESKGENLKEKIDDLVKKELLARPQADLLHEERYIGNYAIHEIDPPSKRDFVDGLEIIEGLLKTLYTFPEKAKRLKDKREKKKQDKKVK